MNEEINTRERPLTAVRKTELLEKITAYVDANLSSQVTLRSISEAFHVSVSTVTQLFQKKANTTFHQYLTGKRIAAAEALIRNGVPLEEVGRQVGYADHSSFYRAFKQVHGVSPREYRRKKEK